MDTPNHPIFRRFNLNISRFNKGLSRLFALRREMAWVAVGKALTFVGGFASIKILTNLMGAEGYGRLGLGMTIAGMIGMFVYSPLGQVVLRFYSVYRERGTLDLYFSVLKRAHRFFGVVLVLLTMTAGLVTLQWFGQTWAAIVVCASLYGTVSGICGIVLAYQTTIRERKIVSLHQGLDPWLRLIIATLLLPVVPDGGFAALLGYLIASLMIVTSLWKWTVRNGHVRTYWHGNAPERRHVHDSVVEFRAYANPFMIWAGVAAVSAYTDRWMLQHFFGEWEVGIYVALYQIANASITVILSIVNEFMVPIIFERAGTMNSETQIATSSRLLHQTMALSGLFMLLVTGVTYWYGEEIIRLMTPSEFADFHHLLWPLVLGLSLFNVGQLLTLKGFNYQITHIYIIPKVIQALSFVAFALILTPRYAIAGVALSLCSSSLLYVVSVCLANTTIDKTVVYNSSDTFHNSLKNTHL